jgi:hypothetical protein
MTSSCSSLSGSPNKARLSAKLTLEKGAQRLAIRLVLP